jgi:pimeloyl-ACP methyl ester carboxylesterase
MRFKCAEGNMDRSDSASFCSVRRGRRPHGTLRNFMRDSKNDPFFLPPGAEAFKRDNPNAQVHFYDTGHFALETHAREIATAIRDFLGRKLTQTSAA